MAKQVRRASSIRFLRLYHVRENEKDPIIDAVHTAMDDAQLSAGKIDDMGGPSATTIYNWIDGPTRRPQWATAVAALRCCGYDVALIKRRFGDGRIDATRPKLLNGS